MPELAYVGCIEISPHDADTIYVAATRYKLADYRPYLFRSTDGGQSSSRSTAIFLTARSPAWCARIRRARGCCSLEPRRASTVSLNDGRSWTRMGGGLPVVPVYDLKIKGTDLVAGTHGRSFWILDDITPLRGLADDSHGSRLFEPRTTVRTKLHFGALRSLRPSGVCARAGSRSRRRDPNLPQAGRDQRPRISGRRGEPAERRDRPLLAG